MEVEVLPDDPRTRHERKRHEESTDPEIKELDAKYAIVKQEHPSRLLANINEDDVHTILNKYATDPTVDMYTVADTLHVGTTALSNLLKDKKFADEYQAAKKRRGNLLAQKGLEVAYTPYNKLMAGEDIPHALVKAAALAANYSLNMAKALDPELNPQRDSGQGGNNIAVVVNTSVELNI